MTNGISILAHTQPESGATALEAMAAGSPPPSGRRWSPTPSRSAS